MNLSNSIVLDSSALLAFLAEEVGHEKVRPIMKHAIMSSINFSECYYILRKSINVDEVTEILSVIKNVISVDQELAEQAGKLFFNTRNLGLSLADCICLSLANQNNIPVYTADKQWLKLEAMLNLNIVCIR
ncbi:hypothetical protein NOVO_02060 [Rickettsiales bacterium Ac37b]|nr:hypothetical protein NOVO_02060 [Rickettsiales bacterium Ac37b]